MRRSRARAAARLRGLVVAAGLMSAAPLVAQEPTPRPAPRDTIPARSDTIPPIRRDTVVVPIPPEALPADTAPAPRDTVPVDSLRPPPAMPAYPEPAPVGFAAGRWVWTESELKRFHGRSLLELLERVPGLVVTRGGVFGQPTGLGAWGGGGGRVRVLLDGYELDALSAATFDVTRLALVDVREVRVERGLLETRVEVETFRLADARPFSQVEGIIGNERTRGLRALFARPLGTRDVITLGFDLLDTEGLPLREAYTGTTGLARWTHEFSRTAGLEVEYRQTGVDRPGQRFGEGANYRDVFARLRARPTDALTVEAAAGRSWRIPDTGDSLKIDAVRNQAHVRALLGGRTAWAEGTGRVRFGERGGYPAPTADLALRTGIEPFRGLGATGGVRYATVGGVSGVELSGGVRLGPIARLSLFAQGATGTRGIGVRRDSISPLVTVGGTEAFDTVTTFPATASATRALRAGAEWAGGGMVLGAAMVWLDSDRLAPFGLPFDARVASVEDPLTSPVLESYLALPLFYRPLRLEAAYTRSLDDLPERVYLPVEQLRASLSWHDLFYDGQLEPTARVEVVHRGSALTPALDETPPAFGARTQPYTLLNAYLQIRVLDVRAFVLLENALNLRDVADIPGRSVPGQRVYYGVRWHFYN